MEKNGYIIKIEGLTSGYGKKEILHELSMEVKQGEIATVIGRNGVGKTTLLNTIMGFLKPMRGNIFFQGNDISGCKPHVAAGMGIAYVPQGKAIFPYLTVEEHLDLGAWTLQDKDRIKTIREKVFHLFPRLEERKSQKGGTLSGGERQMLSIGRALMGNPKLLLLDEPSFGLAPKLVDSFFQAIRKINQEGVAILLVEQNAMKALANSHRGYVMDMGKIKFKGESKSLLENEEVRLSYLGGRGKQK